MAILEKIPAIRELSEDDKRQLIDELWTEMDGDPDSGVSPEIIELLDRRMEDYRRNPDSASSWDEVKQRLKALRG